MARLHIYPHTEPKEDLVIAADPAALRSLAKALLKAAQTPLCFERVKLHTSDGHEYTAMIVSDVSEKEWQDIPPAYRGAKLPKLQTINDYESVKRELLEKRP